MLINLFDVDGKTLVPSAACYAIPWLKRIMDDYKESYLDMYKYIFFTTCPDGSINPYINLPEDEREEVIIADLSPLTFELEDEYLLKVIEQCKKMYETPTVSIWKGAKIMLEEMTEKLSNTKMTFGKNGNSTELQNMMKNIAVFTRNYMELENMVKEEQVKVRGDKYVPYWQSLSYKETKNYENE